MYDELELRTGGAKKRVQIADLCYDVFTTKSQNKDKYMYPKPIVSVPHKKFKHLTLEERFLIQFLHRRGSSPYAISKEIGCASNTVRNEIKRGMEEYNIFGRIIREYSAQKGNDKYLENRKNCNVSWKLTACADFIRYAIHKFRNEKWSFDASVGYAKANNLFKNEEIPNTKSMYNWTNAGFLAVKRHELPEATSRSPRKKKNTEAKRSIVLGKSIEERPENVENREEFGHWEIDTVVGKRQGQHSVLLTLTERKTRFEIVRKVEGKTKEFIKAAVENLFGDYQTNCFDIFKTITPDNGLEFASMSELEELGLQVFFAHPYSSYERGTNERHNRIIRTWIPKGKNIDNYDEWFIEDMEDFMNNLPRKILGYKTPAQLFEEELDKIYRKTA